MPKANRDWWALKLEKNRTRDRAKDAALIDAGWVPLHVWEHQDPAAAAAEIAAMVSARLSARELDDGRAAPGRRRRQ